MSGDLTLIKMKMRLADWNYLSTDTERQAKRKRKVDAPVDIDNLCSNVKKSNFNLSNLLVILSMVFKLNDPNFDLLILIINFIFYF